MRFLIVDDSAFMRMQIKQAFSAFPFVEFEEAVNGMVFPFPSNEHKLLILPVSLG
jgi:hypothetical protein